MEDQNKKEEKRARTGIDVEDSKSRKLQDEIRERRKKETEADKEREWNVRAIAVWPWTQNQPKNPENLVPCVKQTPKKAQTPTLPYKKGISGRGRGVTDKKGKVLSNVA